MAGLALLVGETGGGPVMICVGAVGGGGCAAADEREIWTHLSNFLLLVNDCMATTDNGHALVLLINICKDIKNEASILED